MAFDNAQQSCLSGGETRFHMFLFFVVVAVVVVVVVLFEPASEYMHT